MGKKEVVMKEPIKEEKKNSMDKEDKWKRK